MHVGACLYSLSYYILLDSSQRYGRLACRSPPPPHLMYVRSFHMWTTIVREKTMASCGRRIVEPG